MYAKEVQFGVLMSFGFILTLKFLVQKAANREHEYEKGH